MTLEEEAILKYPITEPCCRLVRAKKLWQREQYILKHAEPRTTIPRTQPTTQSV